MATCPLGPKQKYNDKRGQLCYGWGSGPNSLAEANRPGKRYDFTTNGHVTFFGIFCKMQAKFYAVLVKSCGILQVNVFWLKPWSCKEIVFVHVWERDKCPPSLLLQLNTLKKFLYKYLPVLSVLLYLSKNTWQFSEGRLRRAPGTVTLGSILLLLSLKHLIFLLTFSSSNFYRHIGQEAGGRRQEAGDCHQCVDCLTPGAEGGIRRWQLAWETLQRTGSQPGRLADWQTALEQTGRELSVA